VTRRDSLSSDPSAMAEKFDEAWKHGDEDDREDHESEVFLYRRKVSEVIAGKEEDTDPRETCHDVVYGKPPVRHGADAGHKRGESANDRDEPGDHDCLAAMSFVEAVCAVKIVLVHEADFFPVKDLRSHKMSDPVVDRVSRHRRSAEKPEQPPDFQRADGSECAGGEEKRIPGKKGRYHKPCLTEYDQKKDEICPEAVTVDDYVQMPVEVYEDIDEITNQFHRSMQSGQYTKKSS
jgi:hypothetical protein